METVRFMSFNSTCRICEVLNLDRDGHQPLVHDFFGDGPTTSARLLLRQTVRCEYLLKDHWATSLYRDLGRLTSRWTPA